MTFQSALERSEETRHILLGNGFSRACRNDLFAYDALFTRAKEQLSSRTVSAFQALCTTDFEKVMRALKQTRLLVNAYSSSYGELASILREDANSLRNVLANVIASNHLERSGEISDDQFRMCRAFLNNFKTFYTLNYDLLLYWALMKEDVDDLNLKCDDGFRQPRSGPMEYVVWDISDAGKQNVFYMHGALHVFDAGSEVQKYTWSNTGIALIDQIREALDSDRYPIFVSEGASSTKLDRVMHSSYLSRGYRSLSNIGNSLFIFGHSLQENDEHVLRCIEKSNVSSIFVSVFGDPGSLDNRRIMNRARNLEGESKKPRGHQKKDREILFYDAESARIWG